MVPSNGQIRSNALITRQDLVIAAAAAGAHLFTVIGARLRVGRFGFPLDDGWIFLTYARNLAQRGEWAFIPGVPSTGSTSVLWTPILVPGHWLPLNPVLWAYLMGMLALIAAGLGAARLFTDEQPRWHALAVGLAVALEWHLVWASGSGMETAFFAALVIWFWVWVKRSDPAEAGFGWRNGLTLGLFGGLLMLARPEGLLALAVAGLYGLSRPGPLWHRLRWGAIAGGGLAIMLVPFLGLNLGISGELWPNTFFAKQTEYSVLWQQAYPLRVWQQASTAYIGAHLLALPALILGVARAVRERDWAYILPLIWVVLHWALYALRLPVVYQHGRYAIPTVGILTAYGVWEALRLAKPRSRKMGLRVASLTWLGGIAAGSVLFLVVLAGPAYTRDVTFIEQNMVNTALWVEQERDANTTIAAHDIGALGYFTPGSLVDLAGLVSPEVIPFMLDGVALADYVVESGADYLVVFTEWNDAYRRLVTDPRFCEVWAADQAPDYTYLEGQPGVMTVYEVGCPSDPAVVD